nr:GNAT family N-acetyltransferase [Rhodococcus sp. HNM0569]
MQRAAYVTEAQAHDDLRLPPLRQTVDELSDELGDPSVRAFGLRDSRARLTAAVRMVFSPSEPETVEVGRLIVAPDLQGGGRGSRLLQLVEDRLPPGVTRLLLFTGERSDANLRLYIRFGYRETHRTATSAGYRMVHLVKQVE